MSSLRNRRRLLQDLTLIYFWVWCWTRCSSGYLLKPTISTTESHRLRLIPSFRGLESGWNRRPRPLHHPSGIISWIFVDTREQKSIHRLKGINKMCKSLTWYCLVRPRHERRKRSTKRVGKQVVGVGIIQYPIYMLPHPSENSYFWHAWGENFALRLVLRPFFGNDFFWMLLCKSTSICRRVEIAICNFDFNLVVEPTTFFFITNSKKSYNKILK